MTYDHFLWTITNIVNFWLDGINVYGLSSGRFVWSTGGSSAQKDYAFSITFNGTAGHGANGDAIDLIQIRNFEYIYDGRISNRNLSANAGTQIKIGFASQNDACILPLTNISTFTANVDNHLTPTPLKANVEKRKIILTISGGNITSGKIDILLKGFGYF